MLVIFLAFVNVFNVKLINFYFYVYKCVYLILFDEHKQFINLLVVIGNNEKKKLRFFTILGPFTLFMIPKLINLFLNLVFRIKYTTTK